LGGAPDSAPTPVSCVPAPSTPKTSRSGSGALDGAALDVSIEGDDRAATFGLGSRFTIRFAAETAGPDTLGWQIKNYTGAILLAGTLPVAPGATEAELICKSSGSGYFAVYGSLQSSGATVPEQGSRPRGFATFGVLPNFSHLLPATPLLALDDRRFGLQGTNFIESGKCCDGNGLEPINRLLGSSWVLDARHQGKTEPKHAGEYDPDSYPLDVGLQQGDLARIVTLNGIPGWASAAPEGAPKGSYPPASFEDFRAYAARVGRETERVRRQYIPKQRKNYYQVTWEPDPGTPTHWLGSDADFVSLYRAVWQGVHSTDPNAVVMGPTNIGLQACAEWLNRLAPLGLTHFLDAVACHGYYTTGTSSASPPESSDLPQQMQELRRTIASLLPPATRLFVTETGIAYPANSKYTATFPTTEVLAQHAQAVVRTHLILLGEGADVSFLFYSADYTSEVGFGLYFNLSMPHPDFGSPHISPKPAAMAVAAMTRLIGASRTLGALRNMPAGAYGYSFAQPGNLAITALWAHAASFNASVPYRLHLGAPGSSGNATLIDAMGNPANAPYSDGTLPLTLTEMPIYVVSASDRTLLAQLRAPVGYGSSP
jgi:hypothetical protein